MDQAATHDVARARAGFAQEPAPDVARRTGPALTRRVENVMERLH
jgi:hypothetical protein